MDADPRAARSRAGPTAPGAARWTSARACRTRWRSAQRHVRELRPLPLRREPRALRDQPDGDARRRREHPDHGELRALLRTTAPPTAAIPSFQGGPAETDVRTFFGDPSQSWSDAPINVGTAALEHDLSPTVQVRNRLLFGDYNKMYQNVFPGAVDSTGTLGEHVGLQQPERPRQPVQPDRAHLACRSPAAWVTRCWPAWSWAGR